MSLLSKNRKAQQRQKGAITILGIGGIFAALFAFDLVMTYTKLKIVDRELDNYARSVAEVALRSELSVKTGNEGEGLTKQEIQRMLNDVYSDGRYLSALDNGNKEIIPVITFGNVELVVDSEGEESEVFVPLTTYADNPKAVDPTPEFNAVAVELSTDDSPFFDVFVPSGQSIVVLDGLESCVCDRRYEMCVGATFFGDQLAHAGDANTPERKNYCEYGYQPSHPDGTNTKKYPYAMFRSAWIGNQPIKDDVNLSLLGLDILGLYEIGFDQTSYDQVMQQQEVMLEDGADPLYQDSGLGNTIDNLLDLEALDYLLDSDPEPVPFILKEDETQMNSNDISSGADQYHCRLAPVQVDFELLTLPLGLIQEDFLGGPCSGNLVNNLTGFLGDVVGVVTNLVCALFPKSELCVLVDAVEDTVDSNVMYDDDAYVGRSGVCVEGTESLSKTKCLYSRVKVEYESCNAIVSRDPRDPSMYNQNLFVSIVAGPSLSYPDSIEVLTCDTLNNFRYKSRDIYDNWQYHQ